MIAPTKQANEVRPGDALPTTERRFSAVDLVMYGAATWDWHRLHYDAVFAEEMKLPGPIIDGQMYGALFAKQAMDWLGAKAFVRKLDFRMRAMAFAGDALAAEGEVVETRAEDGHAVVVLAQRLRNGEQLIAEATTEVRLPA
ncbi:MAG: MaoC family dehydratase [Alphaproteobacteria bacterium]|jgi:acyl dehydratase|nr:MaoC family dehydratase [Alphaproteobacteria bacterium]MDP6815369.1 MaoC family dehydratase [Alphaproteobacteria bacterium]